MPPRHTLATSSLPAPLATSPTSSLSAPLTASPTISLRSALTGIRRFQIYYGPVDQHAIQQLRESEMALIEPQHIALPHVRDLQASGTLVIGYLSVMEAPTWNAARFSRLQASDFYHRNGQHVHFPAWDSYLLDLREPHVQDVLLQEMRTFVLEKEVDGAFLDTVGDIEEYVPQGAEREEMMQAYITWLQKVRDSFPSLHLVQNRGFDVLEAAALWLDGLLWEDWRGDLVDDEWVQARLAILANCHQRGLPIFTQSARPEPIHEETARERGFVHLTRSGGYHTLD